MDTAEFNLLGFFFSLLWETRQTAGRWVAKIFCVCTSVECRLRQLNAKSLEAALERRGGY